VHTDSLGHTHPTYTIHSVPLTCLLTHTAILKPLLAFPCFFWRASSVSNGLGTRHTVSWSCIASYKSCQVSNLTVVSCKVTTHPTIACVGCADAAPQRLHVLWSMGGLDRAHAPACLFASRRFKVSPPPQSHTRTCLLITHAPSHFPLHTHTLCTGLLCATTTGPI